MNQPQPPAPAGLAAAMDSPPGDPCIMVIFGASGDLTKRLLMPALYNLHSDGLLPAQFAVVGIALDELTTDTFRERMSRDIRQFNTRTDFDEKAWNDLCGRLYYTPGKFGDAVNSSGSSLLANSSNLRPALTTLKLPSRLVRIILPSAYTGEPR